MNNWLRKHPQVRTIRVAAADLNGQARGKRIPTRFADKVTTEGTRFPMSVLNLDIWGEDIDDSPLVFDSGDAERRAIARGGADRLRRGAQELRRTSRVRVEFSTCQAGGVGRILWRYRFLGVVHRLLDVLDRLCCHAGQPVVSA